MLTHKKRGGKRSRRPKIGLNANAIGEANIFLPRSLRLHFFVFAQFLCSCRRRPSIKWRVSPPNRDEVGCFEKKEVRRHFGQPRSTV